MNTSVSHPLWHYRPATPSFSKAPTIGEDPSSTPDLEAMPLELKIAYQNAQQKLKSKPVDLKQNFQRAQISLTQALSIFNDEVQQIARLSKHLSPMNPSFQSSIKELPQRLAALQQELTQLKARIKSSLVISLLLSNRQSKPEKTQALHLIEDFLPVYKSLAGQTQSPMTLD